MNLDAAISQCLRSAFEADSSDAGDGYLMERYVSQRDKFAFELLVRRHMSLVHRICRAVLHDHQAAEDAAQAVFLVLARKAESIRSRDSVVVWLTQTAYRVAIRASKKKIGPRAENIDPNELGEKRIEKDYELLGALHLSIAELPDKFRIPIVLCYFQGLSHVEAAKELRLPLGTLNSRVERAKELLLRGFKRRGLTLPAGFASILAAESLPAMEAKKIAAVVDAAFAFGVRQSLPASLSPASIHLAHGEIKTMLIQKLRFASAVACVCAATTFVGAMTLDFPNLGEIASDAMKAQPVLAPVADSDQPIDAKTIEKFEKLGAFYGGFVADADSTSGDPTGFSTFVCGPEAAKTGLPGFCWYRSTTVDLSLLPKVNCEFGLSINGSIAKTKNPLESLDKLILISIQSTSANLFTNDSINELIKLKHLKSCKITANLDDDGIKKLAEFKQLETVSMSSGYIKLEGMKALAKLELKNLELGGIIDDVALQELSNFKKLEIFCFGGGVDRTIKGRRVHLFAEGADLILNELTGLENL